MYYEKIQWSQIPVAKVAQKGQTDYHYYIKTYHKPPKRPSDKTKITHFPQETCIIAEKTYKTLQSVGFCVLLQQF